MSIDREWIKKFWYVYTIEYYSAIRRNNFESVLMKWMNLGLLYRDKSKRERQILYSNIHICNLDLEKWY